MPGHNHHHGDLDSKKLYWAVGINILLTVFQVIGGVLSGSLSLVADALHNFSDAGALIVAVIARKIGNKPADNKRSYGYKRAEILGTLINSTTLVLIGVYLCYESVNRYFNPGPIDGWIVVWVAALALVIDIATALLVYLSGGKDNLNMRAAFIHNVSDALASVVVIVAGTLIILYQIYIVDLIATVAISLYVVYHGVILLKQSISILMQSVPSGIDLDFVREQILTLDGVEDADHIHLWQLDDKKVFFEGHLVIAAGADSTEVKRLVRDQLIQKFQVDHATIEVHKTKA